MFASKLIMNDGTDTQSNSGRRWVRTENRELCMLMGLLSTFISSDQIAVFGDDG
jgi:hypothetical protein